jgi:hypothetical protein
VGFDSRPESAFRAAGWRPVGARFSCGKDQVAEAYRFGDGASNISRIVDSSGLRDGLLWCKSHIVSNDDEETAKLLAPYIQSGNLNFLIGSGASLPAIKTAGDIEKKLDKLIKDGKTEEADRERIGFIEAIGKTYKQLKEDAIKVAGQ